MRHACCVPDFPCSTGQNATVAVMSYSGYDIEVSLLLRQKLNEELCSHHFLRCVSNQILFRMAWWEVFLILVFGITAASGAVDSGKCSYELRCCMGVLKSCHEWVCGCVLLLTGCSYCQQGIYWSRYALFLLYLSLFLFLPASQVFCLFVFVSWYGLQPSHAGRHACSALNSVVCYVCTHRWKNV